MEFVRRPPEIILLIGEDKDSNVARELLKERQIRFAEVNKSTIREPKLKYPLPTLFVRGSTYFGLREIKICINRNLYL